MASLIEYINQADRGIAQNRGQELQNERMQLQNSLYRGNPILAASSSLPAGYGGQVVLGKLLGGKGFEGAADQIDNYNQAVLDNTIANANMHQGTANTAGFRPQASIVKEQIASELQALGYTSGEISDLTASGKVGAVAANRIPRDQYYSNPNAVPLQSNGVPNNNYSNQGFNQPQRTGVNQPQGAAQIYPNNPMPRDNTAQNQLSNTQGKLSKGELTTAQINQAAWGENLESSLSFVKNNLDSISSYTPDKFSKAGVNTVWEKLKGRAGGEQSKKFKAYNTFEKTMLPQIVNQATSMYHTSIQPEVRAKLEREFTRQGDESNDMYQTRINAAIDLIEKEKKQFLKNGGQLLNSSPAQIGENQSYENSSNETNGEIPEGRTRVINPRLDPSDELYSGTIPNKQLEQALNQGYKRG